MPHTCPKDDLSEDALIQELLNEAEARLQSSASPVDKSLTSTAPKHTEHHADARRLPSLVSDAGLKSYLQRDGEISTLNTTQIPVPQEKTYRSGLAQTREKQDNAGTDWFNLPKTKMTPELKREFQLLRMRNVLDPKRHYKKESGNAQTPEYSQVGTIIEGPTEFFKSRVVKKERKKTFVEEALATEKESGRFKAKYNQIQTAKTSGKKSHYNRLRAKRRH